MRTSNYEKWPRVDVPGGAGSAWRGWSAIAVELRDQLSRVQTEAPGRPQVLAIECYSGVSEPEICAGLRAAFDAAVWINTRDAFRSAHEIDRLVAPDLGGDDPLFGFLTRLTIDDFLSAEKVAALRARVAHARGSVVVIGPGASVIASHPTLLVYADLARWEAQRRQRRGDISNLGVENRGLKPSLQ